MLTTLLGLIIGLVLFLCCYLGFRQGLRLGMQASKGNIPQSIRNPITVIEEVRLSREQQKRREQEEKEFLEMLAFNGERKKVNNED